MEVNSNLLKIDPEENSKTNEINTNKITQNNQPVYFERKKNFCEKILPTIISNNYIFKLCLVPPFLRLTELEIIQFEKLKSLSLIEYSKDNKNHESLLESLLKYITFEGKVKLKKVEKNENDKEDKLSSSEWRSLGFQSNNPRTDFRAGGILSLKFICFFVKNFSEEFQIMVNLDCFLFAVVAIKVVVSLII